MDGTFSLASFTPSTTATSTSLTSVATTAIPALESSLSKALHSLTGQTTTLLGNDYIHASRAARGALASLSAISVEQVLATATDESVKAQATDSLWNLTQNLEDLAWQKNMYAIHRLTRGGNIFFLVAFSITLAWFTLIFIKSRYWWFNIAFFCGALLEFLGFLGRVLSFSDMSSFSYYVMQMVTLTIAPAFTMGGIYFLLGQLVVIHGRRFSFLKPMWYAYIFIASDITSLVIQAAGGGVASAATSRSESTSGGTDTMIAGIAFQAFSMSVYVILWFTFIWRIYFPKTDPYSQHLVDSQHQMLKPNLRNFLKLFFNTRSSSEYKKIVLEPYYNPKYSDIRQRRLYNYFPLAVTCAIIAIFIRCIYRVVELAQGFRGYLITHEVYIMCLDATMMVIAFYIFLPFHPIIVFGTSNIVRLGDIKHNVDEKVDDEKMYLNNIDNNTVDTAGIERESTVSQEERRSRKFGKFFKR
ncbi:RTA3 [Candida metapsilosis]|uniref:Sphingoid long-chain base transporter RSB1 n=1 Tax=Candida metapsilosis TaxID=273372 RepID=A0A8H8DEK5_9ASCO|nr:RTA3 [Candida metapsilosis]